MELSEQLFDDAQKSGVGVSIERFPADPKHTKALYITICGKPMIIMQPTRTQAELACLLAEELGHHYTGPSRILRYRGINDLRAEATARRWGYRRIISIDRVIKALQSGLRERCDIADYLGVTEEYLEEAVEYYRSTDAWKAIEQEIHD